MNKKKASTVHLKRRFYERYNLEITNQDIKEMVRKIQNQQAEFIERQSNRITIWKLQFRDKDYTIVYDKVRKSIVTVFPEMDEKTL